MRKKIRRFLAFLLVKVLVLETRILPRRIGLSIFGRLGDLAYRFYGRDRERARRNLAAAFPEADRLVVDAMARGVFRWLAMNAFDALSLSHLSRERVLESVSIEGEDHLRIPYERGRGVIGITGHIGCWELLAAYIAQKGYRLAVFTRELKDHRLNRMVERVRRRHGIESIPRGESALGAFKLLRRGWLLGVLIDQDIDVDGIFVPFFGRPAHTPRGAAVFALRSGAAIVPIAIHMRHDGKHRITVLPELEPPPEELDEKERIDELTARCSAAVELLVRIYPQQWVWFHDRWRKRPGSVDGRAE